MVQGWFDASLGWGSHSKNGDPYYRRTPYRYQISTTGPLQEETRVNILKVKFFLLCSTFKDMGGARKQLVKEVIVLIITAVRRAPVE